MIGLLLLGARPHAPPPPADPARTTSCLPCHAEQAGPLSRSRHGQASGPGLWGQLPESGPHVGAGLACLLCHAPAPDQQPWRSAATAPPDAGPGRTPVEALGLALSSAPAAPNPAYDPHAGALGVSCTACHVAGGRIVGARPAPRAPHPVAVDASLNEPSLCARCHQFGSAAAVNGKPLENTWAEWRSSTWARAGATCQSCHLPAGRHLFQGIHTPSLVSNSVQVAWSISTIRTGVLLITNSGAGHDFPTYTTPRVVLSVQAEDARGKPMGAPYQEALGRVVRFDNGQWHELSDTRIEPGASYSMNYTLSIPRGAARLHATVRVEPDAAYQAIYEGLLSGGSLTAAQRREIQAALARARGSAYTIYDEQRNFTLH